MPKKNKLIIGGVLVAVLLAVAIAVNYWAAGPAVPPDVMDAAVKDAAATEPPPPPSGEPVRRARPGGMGGR